MTFDPFENPIKGDDKPAGALVSFPRPAGAKFMKPVKIKIAIMNWILVLLKMLGLIRRRQLAEDEIILDDHELENTYLQDGALMWRGRRYIQVRTEEVPAVKQASFDEATRVSIAWICAMACSCMCVCYLHTFGEAHKHVIYIHT
jgi:hypothetical protein